MSDLLSQTYFWIFLLLAMFGSANTTTKQWAKSQLDDTPIFQTMFYQFMGILSFVIFIIGLIVIACIHEWWYSIVMLILSQVLNRIALAGFNILGIRHSINLLSIIAIPVLSIVVVCLI